MPDTRRHRGPGPQDRRLFAAELLPVLRAATGELSWLLTRGYAETSAVKLVGDRHALTVRQRVAVRRAACADEARVRRRAVFTGLGALDDVPLAIDGFNALIVAESLRSGAPVFVGRDGAFRDIASVHGTWRRIDETAEVIATFARLLRTRRAPTRWILDRPVSNSGRLRGFLLEAADSAGLPWTIDVLNNPDRALAAHHGAVATADAWILDRCTAWTDLPRELAAGIAERAWLIDLGVA